MAGLGAPAGWVATQLQDGDQLDNAPTIAHSLAKIYPATARQIVEGNGVAFTSPAIEGDGGWVRRTGGRKLSNGRWVFSSNSVIFLPAGGPRSAVSGSSSDTTTGREPPSGFLPSPGNDVQEAGGMSPIFVVLGLGCLGFVLYSEVKDRKKGKRQGFGARAA
jgi:hypothetical protein